ncbi:serine aminopeptidase S33 family [Luteibacter rhizovicinus]|uniref:Serine aminopeptidase S33 family n=1 Tax=Luteibacter rhizovicinus TaxID=242606 RepID=A0A4V2W4X6_9GAMM|nr:alpha/beta hydrolase [Luteibacter rhizovicinus]TCV97599.1 serine aminopeptidase S33 family [Luteibacter rhizovicinus]
MSARPTPELPLYFGANRELFGLFHPVEAPASHAVLLCAPLGQDHIRCHRIYRQLANALAADGTPVLRFDYFGTGDSAGDSEDIDWDRCVDDTVEAANELRERAGTDRIVAFGARLGGSISVAASAEARFSNIVAWDPVLDGSVYVARMDALQKSLRTDSRRFMSPRSESDVAGQWIGFATTTRLRCQLDELRLEAAVAPTMVLDSLADASPHCWGRLVGDESMVRRLEPATPWDDLDRLEVAILSRPLIQTVTGHVRGTH